MPLPSLKKIPSINGDRSENNRKIRDVETPEQDRDAANKKWVTDTFVAI
jgi:hypothetical protein